MSDQTVELKISSETLERLQIKAQVEGRSLPDLMREAIETYLDDDEIEDTPDEEILEAIREGMKAALSGQRGRPAREVLDEIRRELADESVIFYPVS